MECERNDWIAVSTDGFAEQNATRLAEEPPHKRTKPTPETVQGDLLSAA